MIETLRLPTDRFTKPVLSGLKQKTFIFGKNGTGKSTITQCIKDDYSSEYDIRIFQGYEQIISAQGGELNVISLGIENATLEPQIDELEKEISVLEQEIQNANKICTQKLERLEKANKKLDEFYKTSAKKLKDKHVTLFGINYNKSNFKAAIPARDKATENDISEAEHNIKQNILDIKSPIDYSCLQSINDLVQPLNDILQTKIIESAMLKFATEERQWVHQGLSLHENRTNCLFCNSLLNESRLKDLNTYFSDITKSLYEKMHSYESKLTTHSKSIDSLDLINPEEYFLTFKDYITSLNERLGFIKTELHKFIQSLEEKLVEKQNDIYSIPISVEQFDITSIQDFIKDYQQLYEKNKINNNDIETIKRKSEVLLRNHLVAVECENNNYTLQNHHLSDSQTEYNNATYAKNIKENTLANYKKDLQKLKRKTINEDLAAEYINKYIRGLGNHSFTLSNNHTSNDQKGIYQILDYQGNPRKIETLSTGEKNIVAFLWFIYHLQDSNQSSEKEQIIIFDDPMNSNDDTTQYLIISELQKLLANTRSQIFILTHNAHFYINTRYNWWSKDKSNKATFRLIKNGVYSDIINVYPKNDIKTSYDGLWDEFNWLYTYSDKPEYLLNPIRRILETYKNFNHIEDLFGDYKEAEKLFNVNSHSIDDLESDLNGKSNVEIKEMLQLVFEKHNALSHFKAHCSPYSNDN